LTILKLTRHHPVVGRPADRSTDTIMWRMDETGTMRIRRGASAARNDPDIEK
jgi:hypothetical protein